MGCDVFANGREVACKASTGKSICAFPDVCMTPPTPPAGFLPIPYPNTAMASDTTDGSTSVTISGKEVVLKNKSHFKTSMGDEAATKSTPMGVVTHGITGKVFFTSWSMDVKVEGENVARHLDMTTHNHSSIPANAPPMVFAALAAAFQISECEDAVTRVLRECDPWDEKFKCPEEHEARIDKALADRVAAKTRLTALGPVGLGMSDSAARNHPSYRAAQENVNNEYMAYTGELMKNACHRAMRCILMTYDDMNAIKCRHQTPEHMIEQSSAAGVGNYRLNDAPCAFTEGTSWHLGDHGVMSAARRDIYESWSNRNPNDPYTTRRAAEIGAAVHQDSNAAADCDPICTEEQLVNGHAAMNVDENDQLNPTQTGIADASEAARRREIMELQQQQVRDMAGRG
jgi:hypothetical protein